MRRCLCAVLLSCALAFGSLNAADLSVPQAQLLINEAQKAAADKPVKVTLVIDGKSVVFNVTRDALGYVNARPEADPANAGLTISQISIQMQANDKGLLKPTSIAVVSSNLLVTVYPVKLNDDGSIAGLGQPTGDQSTQVKLAGGIGGGTSGAKNGVYYLMPKDTFLGFTSAQLGLPAGSESGTREASASLP